MNVHGVEITEEQIEKARQRMMEGPFTALQIIVVLERAGVPGNGDVAMRAADRLVQKNRKAGKIAFRDKQWHPVTGTGDAA